MRLLLDTHIWAWSLLDPGKLGRRISSLLASPTTELWLSPISTWELLLLIERGRVVVDGDPTPWVAQALDSVPFREAPVTHAIAIESRRLRFRHPDPADRFIAATAKVYELTLVTADERLLRARDVKAIGNT